MSTRDHYETTNVDRQREAAAELARRFVNGDDDTRRAIADGHGDRANARKGR
ncbi:hypothetical protein GCM10010174_80730 [Kutzneria viridogrisea]|uniref:Uncharacterized protein n=1 Tax=Kutzneria viridogrisea TaxID=47990 RepID=A0ABR6BYZ9_9PSEU|nr:hypothetical protein [Kutzneria viridogrisea]